MFNVASAATVKRRGALRCSPHFERLPRLRTVKPIGVPQFAVSVSKLAVRSVFRLGLYELDWCYKQWEAERRRERADLSPFWQTFFAPTTNTWTTKASMPTARSEFGVGVLNNSFYAIGGYAPFSSNSYGFVATNAVFQP